MILNNEQHTLSAELGVQAGDRIAFVGAGGKTTLMLKLADELRKSSLKVAITTTTKICINERPENSELILEKNIDSLIVKAKKVLSSGQIPVLGTGLNERGDRILGFDPLIVDKLANKFDFLLIEADGARQRSFKIPRSHEPPVPDCTTKLCIVAGLDTMGKPINDDLFYKVDMLQNLGVKAGEIFTPEIMRKLLFHPKGYLRFHSDSCQVYLILNKFDMLNNPEQINDICNDLYHNKLQKILVTSTTLKPIVQFVPTNSDHKIIGVILAAGESKRFNGVKQCAKLDGETLLARVTKHALGSQLDGVVLVLGHEMELVLKGLGNIVNENKLSIVDNHKYREGMSSSIKTGLAIVREHDQKNVRTHAIMILLGDQPDITSELIDKLLVTYKYSNARLCVPIVDTQDTARLGHPVIIGKRLFAELAEITGDIGAREVVKRNVDLGFAKLLRLPDENSQLQINTQDDLVKYLGAEK